MDYRSIKISAIIIMGLSVMLSACATAPNAPGAGYGSNYTPVIDGPKDERYYRDLRQCRELAYSVQSNQEQEAGKNAAIGAVVGAASGAIVSRHKNKELRGALAGAAIGAGSTVAGAASDAKTVISRCMAGRGYNVLL